MVGSDSSASVSSGRICSWAVETLLERLLALKARRAAEEAAGTVRWLRPEFQNPAHRGEQTRIDASGAEADAGEAGHVPAAALAPAERRAWPQGLPDQIKAVADVLAASVRPLSLDELAAHFNARGRWRDRLPTIVATLEALGRARQVDGGRWQGA